MGAYEDDWYLREWMAHFGKRQAALTNELGWTKGRANQVWHGQQPYQKKIVNELAAWLGVRNYELLMPPREAFAIRRLRESAATIVAEEQAPFEQATQRAPPPGAPSDADNPGAPRRRRYG